MAEENGAVATDGQDNGGQAADNPSAELTAGADNAAASIAAAASEGGSDANQVEFPSDWRERMVGEDAKGLNVLKRFNSPKDFSNAYFALNQRISSGELKRPLPKDATDEQVMEWRKENGVPDKPEAYLSELPKGLEYGDEEKASMAPFLDIMHKQNVPPAAVHGALSAYKQIQASAIEKMQERDVQIADATQDELRTEWGPDYRANINAANAFLDSQFPAELRDALNNARLGDEHSTPLLHSPHVLRAFASLGRVLNPQSTVTHGKGMDGMDAMEDQIKAYEKRMGGKDWFKDDKAQAHYRELVTMRERMGKR